jgi:hypothetical protein
VARGFAGHLQLAGYQTQMPTSIERMNGSGTLQSEDRVPLIQVTLTFAIESTATLSRPGMPLKPARVARLVAFSSRPDRIGSMARRKCRDVRTVACGARSPSFRRCAVVSEAVPDSRRSRVSPWDQPEVEANPSASGQLRPRAEPSIFHIADIETILEGPKEFRRNRATT